MHKRKLPIALFFICAWIAGGPFAGQAYAIRLVLAEHLFDIAAGFSAPSDVAASRQGLIFVVDGVHHRVAAFDERGRQRFFFGSQGSGPGEFQAPVGIDVDNDGGIYIADAGNHRIQQFTADGTFVRQIRLPAGSGHPADPVDVAVAASQKRCYVSDNDNHRILVIDLLSGTTVAALGEKGTGELQFRYPFLLAVDANDNLFAVDVINTRVQAIGPAGGFRNLIGGWGVEKGQFFRPKGTAVDGAGRVLVSDSYLGVVQVFDADGTFHAALGDPASRRVLKFRTPVGIDVDQRGRIYVVEMLANKISVYRPVGESESF